MSISPQTLREVEFRSSLRGYHPDDVDEFLERMAAGIELLHERIRETTEQAVRVEQARTAELPPDDDSMRTLLTASQEAADAALLAARTAAAGLVRSAEAYAGALADEVRGTLDRTLAEARAQLEADLRRLDASRRRLMTEVTAAERLVLEQGVFPPARPSWPTCLLAVEYRFEAEPYLV
jgi:cell division initiation protein